MAPDRRVDESPAYHGLVEIEALFDRHVTVVRDAKGEKDRGVMLPRSQVPAVCRQLLAVRAFYEADRHAISDGIETAHALELKFPK